MAMNKMDFLQVLYCKKSYLTFQRVYKSLSQRKNPPIFFVDMNSPSTYNEIITWKGNAL